MKWFFTSIINFTEEDFSLSKVSSKICNSSNEFKKHWKEHYFVKVEMNTDCGNLCTTFYLSWHEHISALTLFIIPINLKALAWWDRAVCLDWDHEKYFLIVAGYWEGKWWGKLLLKAIFIISVNCFIGNVTERPLSVTASTEMRIILPCVCHVCHIDLQNKFSWRSDGTRVSKKSSIFFFFFVNMHIYFFRRQKMWNMRCFEGRCRYEVGSKILKSFV